MKFTAKIESIDGAKIVLDGGIRHHKGYDDVAVGKSYAVEIKEIKSKRSAEQNRLMWALLSEIDKAINGERSNDAWSIYCDCLERAGACFEFIIAPLASESSLNRAFRAVRLMEEVNIAQGVFKCYYGSSKMDTKEMSNLIECVLDMAEEAGVSTDYYKGLL